VLPHSPLGFSPLSQYRSLASLLLQCLVVFFAEQLRQYINCCVDMEILSGSVSVTLDERVQASKLCLHLALLLASAAGKWPWRAACTALYIP
jgi:hypothetical protein